MMRNECGNAITVQRAHVKPDTKHKSALIHSSSAKCDTSFRFGHFVEEYIRIWKQDIDIDILKLMIKGSDGGIQIYTLLITPIPMLASALLP